MSAGNGRTPAVKLVQLGERSWTWRRHGANGAVVAVAPRAFGVRSNALRAARAEAKVTGARLVDLTTGK
ncbi:hypothetical protein OG579_17005 [Williamsia herbipolensis]|uniref:DUF1508 domain-containing protein n=1 Tax=Williamsia herbipolensis TaxID=1603258 RepID=A0AAU4K041_9NOCA|nr:hypothetical protein [Williamsia herbipolensis]